MKCIEGVKGLAGFSWGQPVVKLLGNTIWLLGVIRGQSEGNCLEMRRATNVANDTEHYAAAGALVFIKD